MTDKKSIEAYPLYWPSGYPRTKYPVKSRFKEQLTIAQAADELENELSMLSAKNVILSTNIPLTLSGNPRSGIGAVKDTGIACYFKRKDKDVVLCCDNYKRVQDNIHAVGRTVNALRQISRDGVSDFLDRAFTGFTALPENAGDSTVAWWDVMGLNKDASFDETRKKYLFLAKLWHPDSGDETGRFYLLNKAWQQAQRELGG